MPKTRPSRFLAQGVTRLSRSASYVKRYVYKKKKPTDWKKKPKTEKKAEPKVKKFGASTREIKKKTPKFYPEETPRHRLASRKSIRRPMRLRSSIKPGTVLILVAGPYRGHRVVFLKQLKSGLLLINGPFKVNGVPIRRVNHAYVIATSTRIDISKVKIDPKFDDKYFRPTKKKKTPPKAKAAKPADAAAAAKPKAEKKPKEKAAEKPKSEKKKSPEDKKEKAKRKDLFSSAKSKKKKVPRSRIEDQKALDSLLIPAIKRVPLLRKYLQSRFTLRKGQYPHIMKF